MLNNKEEMIKEIVQYNKELIDSVDGEINEIVNDLVLIKFEEYDVWNPLMDITMRYKVEPLKEYGQDKINQFINDFKNNI